MKVNDENSTGTVGSGDGAGFNSQRHGSATLPRKFLQVHKVLETFFFTWLLKLATEKERVEGNLRSLPLLLSEVCCAVFISFSFSGVVAIAAPSFPLSAAIAAPSNWSRDPPADLLVDPADL